MKIFPNSQRLEDIAEQWERYSQKPKEIEPARAGEESVWDYPRPPYMEEVSDHFCVKNGDKIILDCHWAIKVAETASPPCFYFKKEDFKVELEREKQTSECEWKGEATYYSIEDQNCVAFSYNEPFDEYAELKGLIGFYPGRFETKLNGEIVQAQPGRFYAGWVIDKIKGPFKGEPGSLNW